MVSLARAEKSETIVARSRSKLDIIPAFMLSQQVLFAGICLVSALTRHLFLIYYGVCVIQTLNCVDNSNHVRHRYNFLRLFKI